MEDLQSNFALCNEILKAVDYMGQSFFEEVDPTLLQKELTVFFNNI